MLGVRLLCNDRGCMELFVCPQQTSYLIWPGMVWASKDERWNKTSVCFTAERIKPVNSISLHSEFYPPILTISISANRKTALAGFNNAFLSRGSPLGGKTLLERGGGFGTARGHGEVWSLSLEVTSGINSEQLLLNMKHYKSVSRVDYCSTKSSAEVCRAKSPCAGGMLGVSSSGKGSFSALGNRNTKQRK